MSVMSFGPATRTRPALVLLAVCIAGGLLPASLTGASVALPDIGANLHAGIVPVQWVVNAYNLTFASFMLVAGALADLVGRRRMFAAGAALFAVCAAGSAVAGDILLLDLARGLAGVGAAMILTGGSAMLPTVFSGAKLAKAFGLLGSSFGAGLALGPSTSGFLVGAFGWRAVFFAHLAVCLLVLCLVPLLPESRDPDAKHVDLAGTVTFTGALALLTVAMVQGPQWGWGSMATLGLLVGFAVLIAAFIVAEKTQQRPMFDLALFRQPQFVAVCLIPFALALGFVSLLVFLPSYFIGVLGYSTQRSGLVMLILTAPVLCLPLLSGAASKRIPARYLLGVSLLLVGAGAGWLTVLSPGTSVTVLIGPLVTIGIGVGISFGLLDAAAIGSVPPERAGMAAGMFNTARLASEAIVIAGVGSILVTLTQQRLANGLSHGASGLTSSQLADMAVQGQSVRTLAGQSDSLVRLLGNSYTGALHTVLLVLAAVCIAGAPAIVALLKERTPASASPASEQPTMADAG